MANAKIIAFVAAHVTDAEVRTFATLDERLHPLQQAIDRLRIDVDQLQQERVAPSQVTNQNTKYLILNRLLAAIPRRHRGFRRYQQSRVAPESRFMRSISCLTAAGADAQSVEHTGKDGDNEIHVVLRTIMEGKK